MISLTLDDHKEVGNAIWIEDVWSPEIAQLFPLELQKIILNLNNEWHDLRKDLEKEDTSLSSSFGPTLQGSYLKVCLTDDLKMSYLIERKRSEGKEAPLWLGFNEKILGEKPTWSTILKGFLNLNKLLEKLAKDDQETAKDFVENPIIIELPSFTKTRSEIMAKSKPVTLGLILTTLSFFNFHEGILTNKKIFFCLPSSKETNQYTWWTGLFLSLEKLFGSPKEKEYRYYFSKGEGSSFL